MEFTEQDTESLNKFETYCVEMRDTAARLDNDLQYRRYGNAATVTREVIDEIANGGYFA